MPVTISGKKITANPIAREGDLSRAVAAYNALVGVRLQDMTLAQLRLMLGVLAYKAGFLDTDGRVKPLSQVQLK
jgi:hypothetical protein